MQPECRPSPNRESHMDSSSFSFKAESKLLVVDDNKVNRKVLLILLDQLSFACDAAENGFQALEAVRTKQYRAILMDCHMPEMDGFEATKKIRELEIDAGIHTPIIAVTALGMPEDRQKCLDAGMDDYISKPIDKHTLHMKLNYWLNEEFVYKKLTARGLDQRFEGSGLNSADVHNLLEHIGDEEFDLMLKQYVSQAHSYLNLLGQLLLEKNTEKSLVLSHELRSSSADIGARILCKLCSDLESCIRNDDWKEVEIVYKDLSNSFLQFVVFVSDKLKAEEAGQIQPQ
jgi:CheY-like chemotaxis protein